MGFEKEEQTKSLVVVAYRIVARGGRNRSSKVEAMRLAEEGERERGMCSLAEKEDDDDDGRRELVWWRGGLQPAPD